MSLIHRFARLGAARRGARTGGEHSRSRSAIGRALRIESLEDRRLLAVTVTTLVDENDGVDVGGTSLRDAIAAAPAGETRSLVPVRPQFC
jgi:hypothetical protein